MTEDQAARQRLMAMNLLRLSGAVFVGIGILVLNRKIAMPVVAGWVFLGVGLIDFLVVPQVLARRWRTPRP